MRALIFLFLLLTGLPAADQKPLVVNPVTGKYELLQLGNYLALPSPTGLIRLIPGTGSPEGVVTAPVGSLYYRADGGAGTTLYVKETGTGDTGWAPQGSSGQWLEVTGGLVEISPSVSCIRCTNPCSVRLPHTSNWTDQQSRRVSIRNVSSGDVTVLLALTPGGESDDNFDDGTSSVAIPTGTGMTFEISGPNLWSPFLGPGGGSSIAYDSDAQLYFDLAAGAVGATFSLSAKAAVSNFFLGLKQANLFTKVRRMNLFCADTLAGSLIPCIALDGAAADVNHNFVDADYNVTVGLTGDKATKYLETGVTPTSSGMSLNSSGVFVYMTRTTTNDTGGVCVLGSYSGPHMGLYFRNTATSNVGKIDTVHGTFVAFWGGIVPTDYKGFFGYAVNNGAISSYRNGEATTASAPTVSGTLSSRPLYVMARNNLGTADLFCGGTIAGYALTTGMTQAEVLAFRNLFQQFQADMGRAYVQQNRDISCWGDSLTAGGYPANLAVYRFPEGRGVRNMGIGGETAQQIETRFLADPAGRGDIAIIWVGTNGITNTAANLASIANIVAGLTTTRFIVVTPLINDSPESWIGGVNRPAIDALYAGIAAAYPSNYVNMLSYLQGYGTGVGQDAIDVANGIVPLSLRADTIHLNATGNAYATQALNAFITTKAW